MRCSLLLATTVLAALPLCVSAQTMPPVADDGWLGNQNDLLCLNRTVYPRVGLGTYDPDGRVEVYYCDRGLNGLVVTRAIRRDLMPVDTAGEHAQVFGEVGEGGGAGGGSQATPAILRARDLRMTPFDEGNRPLLLARTEGTSSGMIPEGRKSRLLLTSMGELGLNSENPRAVLDVCQAPAMGVNTPTAIFSMPASNTGTTRHIQLVNSLYEQGYSGLSRMYDQGLFWTDGKGTYNYQGSVIKGTNENSGFVVAPWNHRDGGIRIDKDGNVGVCTYDTKGYALAVGGRAVAEEVVVKLKANWPDHVFRDGYKPMPLGELETFIETHGHLPDAPTQAAVAQNGLSLGETNALLMQKVEELTLYVIELKKEVEQLKAAR